MAYQHHEIRGDLPRARALFDLLCAHGWWRPDSVRVTDAPPVPAQALRFSLFPSPAHGPVVFTVAAAPALQPPTIELYDVAGRVLWRATPVALGQGSWRAMWDGRSLSGGKVRPGLYFARCRTGSSYLRRTLVVTR